MTFLKKTYIFFQQACTHEKINHKDPSSPIYVKKLRRAIRRRSQLDSKNFKK